MARGVGTSTASGCGSALNGSPGGWGTPGSAVSPTPVHRLDGCRHRPWTRSWARPSGARWVASWRCCGLRCPVGQCLDARARRPQPERAGFIGAACTSATTRGRGCSRRFACLPCSSRRWPRRWRPGRRQCVTTWSGLSCCQVPATASVATSPPATSGPSMRSSQRLYGHGGPGARRMRLFHR